MTFGEKLTKARKEAGLTQEKLAEQLDVSFQAVSTWERDENLPDTDHLVRLSRVLNISLDALLRNDIPRGWELGTYPFSPDRTYTQLKTKADALGLRQTRAALPLMREKHAGQYRSPRKDKIPYCVHPMALACHALAMGIRDDDIIAATLLHDVVEDTETRPEELPVNDRVRKTVILLSHNTYGTDRESILPEYFAGIRSDPHAALIKCLDRCDNLETMAYGFTRSKMARYVTETEKYILPLLDVVKSVPEWSDAVYLLRYRMLTLLETLKRLI